MPRSKTPASVTPKGNSNTPKSKGVHPKNNGRPTRVSNLRIRIPNGTPEPKACSTCAVARKSRKVRKI